MKSSVAAVALFALLCFATVSADDSAKMDDSNPLKCVEFEGDKFKGCMHIKKFDTEKGGQLIARGSCKGTNPEDGSTIERTRCYATVSSINGVSPSSLGNRKLLQQTCNIVTLNLSSLFLNVLGLQVIIPAPVVVIINAVAGPDSVLGVLLCAVANLLTPGSGTLAALITALNNLVAALNGA